MQKILLTTTIESYKKITDLAPKDAALLQLAKKALTHSYSPYSNFKVATAIRLKNGVELTGSNQENAAYSLCLCAERVVIAAADAQHPGVPITDMAIVVYNPKKIIDQPAFPCGACRQVICETEAKHQQPIRLIMQGEKGNIFAIASALDILPFSFGKKYLKESIK